MIAFAQESIKNFNNHQLGCLPFPPNCDKSDAGHKHFTLTVEESVDSCTITVNGKLLSVTQERRQLQATLQRSLTTIWSRFTKVRRLQTLHQTSLETRSFSITIVTAMVTTMIKTIIKRKIFSDQWSILITIKPRWSRQFEYRGNCSLQESNPRIEHHNVGVASVGTDHTGLSIT